MQLGKLSSEDIRLLLTLLPVLERERDEALTLVREKQTKIFHKDHQKTYWSDSYEMPFTQHLAQLAVALGIEDSVRAVGTAARPIQVAVESLHEFEKELEATEFTQEDDAQILQSMPVLLSWLNSISNSFRCLLVFGCYLNELIARVREGDDQALLDAVRIDQTVLGCPSVMSRMSRAIILDEQKFLEKVRKAMLGKFTIREQKNYQQMRLVLQVLLEAGAPKLTPEDLHELFVGELNLVRGDGSSKSDKGNVANALRQFAYQFIKQKAVSQN